MDCVSYQFIVSRVQIYPQYVFHNKLDVNLLRRGYCRDTAGGRGSLAVSSSCEVSQQWGVRILGGALAQTRTQNT